ncbi:MAG: hypothetical protein QNJ84_06560 [Alphaproteobacteria bacterium]|nr:hypothetical protein [Alphaproteobacteria bacterium]
MPADAPVLGFGRIAPRRFSRAVLDGVAIFFLLPSAGFIARWDGRCGERHG